MIVVTINFTYFQIYKYSKFNALEDNSHMLDCRANKSKDNFHCTLQYLNII